MATSYPFRRETHVTEPETTPPVHLRLRGMPDEHRIRLALRAALTSAHLLGLAIGTHLRALRVHADPLLRLQARLEEAELRARLALQANQILLARFARIPERRRPHYSPAQRFTILEIRNLLAWSAHETARLFLLSPNTILNWEKTADPVARTAGSTVRPSPPIRRAADVVRSIVQTLTRLGYGGQDQLARAGWKPALRETCVVRPHKCPGSPMP